MSDSLSLALSDGACLVDSTSTTASHNLSSLLISRLSRYYSRLAFQAVSDFQSLEEIQLTTAREALSVIVRIQRILEAEDTPDSAIDQPPVIGTRDLAEIRTLLSIVFKWGVDPLISKLAMNWSNETPPDMKLGDVGSAQTLEDCMVLNLMVSDLLSLLFPGGVQGLMVQTLVTTTILSRHVTNLLKPCIVLGWLPRSPASNYGSPSHAIRSLTLRLLNFLSPSQTIAALGETMSAPPPIPHVRKSCAHLLSQQLLRPQGVQGLFAAVFGEDEISTEDAPIKKLQHITRVLTTAPSSIKPQQYFEMIVPRVVDLLSLTNSSTYKRAAAYTVSRILSADIPRAYQETASKILLSVLHDPLLKFPAEQTNTSLSPSSSSHQQTPFVSVSTLTTLVSNMDPSPTLISALLSPITPLLYSLLHSLDRIKTADPNLKLSLRGLLMTWGKIVDTAEGFDILWSILESDEEGWAVCSDGEIRRSLKPEKHPTLSLLTPEGLRANNMEELDIDADLFDSYPNPVHFVRFLKDIDRPDISSDLFVRLLEVYREYKAKKGSPIQTLHYLQIIIQIQRQLSDGKSSSNILCKPTHLLSFIKHVLDPTTTPSDKSLLKYKNDQDNLYLHLEQGDLSDEGDSDDDTPGADIVTPDEEMIETSVNLLLAVLEANEDLSARTAPVLNDIFSLLEPLAYGGSLTIGPLAREARIVMTARLASTSSLGKSNPRDEEAEGAQEVYQKALKLLQDPILPVRAHGLLLLRQLVVSTSGKGLQGDNRALLPAILSIFLQSVQDDDSYVFLNAVQGLAAMVDVFGKDVLKGLMKEYAEGLGTSLTQHELDVRTRIGEALASVIRRCGDALSIYADLTIPPLFKIISSRDIPTTLRTSSLSLLAECESTNPLAMLPYVTDLTDAMIDLLQLETVPAKPGSSVPDGIDAPTMDTQPTSVNPKFAPFRRAALHFLTLMIRETIKQEYDSSFRRPLISDALMKRATATLFYIGATDEDTVVRVMAREAGEGLDQLYQAMMGI